MAKSKTITPISNIRVTLIGEVNKDNFQETVCTYKFKGQDVNRFVFVERKPGESNTSCINKSKKELMRLHKSGELEAYSNKYIRGAAAGGVGLTRKGIAILVSASVVAAGALITGGIFIGKALINNPYRPTVTFDAVRQGAYFGDNPTLTKVSINVDKGAKVGDFIDAINTPTLKYNDFKAWTLDGSEIERDYQIYENTTFNASFAAQKTTIYLEAGGDGYGSLTPLTKEEAATADINDMINVAAFTVDRGTTLGDALVDAEDHWRFTPGIYLAEEPVSYFKGWSLDGGATYIDPTTDDAVLQKTLDEEKYTLVAGYNVDDPSTVTDFNPSTWSSVVFDADSEKTVKDKTEQTGQWEYNNPSTQATSNIQTIGLMVNPSKVSTLGALRNLSVEKTWYGDPIGDYAGFDYWYDSHDLERTKKEDSTPLQPGIENALNLSAQYNPHFDTDPWRAVINNADLGLNNLHYVYEDDLKDGSLVGLTRDVKLTYSPISSDVKKVRVLGEAQDYAGAILRENINNSGQTTSSGSGGVSQASDYIYTRPVALTFEFAEVTGHSDYNGSLVGYLDSNLYKSTEETLEMMPTELSAGIRRVKKFVSTSLSFEPYIFDVASVKCFDISATECIKNVPDDVLKKELLVNGETNTNIYQYYATSSDPDKVPEGAPSSRFLRTPGTPGTGSIYEINNRSLAPTTQYQSVSDLYPSFCIGRK